MTTKKEATKYVEQVHKRCQLKIGKRKWGKLSPKERKAIGKLEFSQWLLEHFGTKRVAEAMKGAKEADIACAGNQRFCIVVE
jgi:hypothetical protein